MVSSVRICVGQIRTIACICRHSVQIFSPASSVRLLATSSTSFSTHSTNPAIEQSEEYTYRYYTPKHEWVSVSGNLGTVGISEHAQDALGDVVYVQPPEVGTQLAQNDECGAVESVKAASEIYSPVSGTVTQVNQDLEDKPQLINASCYKDGWIFKLELKDPEELKSLMDEKAYQEYLKSSDH